VHCPFCHNPDSRVVDTRIADDGASIRRRRECTHCKKRFTTLETSSFQVVKRSGVVESFSRNKVVSGVKKACQGRPVSDDQLAILAQQVEEQLRSTGVSNVSTNEVGKAILPFLRDLDVIAYLRFASVYRQFDTLDDFEQAIQALRERAQGGDTVSEAGAHADVEPAAPAPAKKPRKARSSRKRSVSNAPTLLGDD
jgi:transcriptional regulator nrdR